jgi:geranylgeranyl diphosphate synthase type II
VAEALSVYRGATLEHLLTLIPKKEPRAYLYDIVRAHVTQGGKGIRSAVCLATCAALGGSAAEALNSAAAIELFHNAALAHDDVEDGGLLRRGRPTLNDEVGAAMAMNAGDVLHVLAMHCLLANARCLGGPVAARVADEFARMAKETVEGQVLKLGWIRDNALDLDRDDYLWLVFRKRPVIRSFIPCASGPSSPNGGQCGLDRLGRLGSYMGVAFQIRDDWLSLRGSQESFGKDILGDLWEGKHTLILMYTLEHCTGGERRWLESYLSTLRHTRSEADVRRAYEIVLRCGSLD